MLMITLHKHRTIIMKKCLSLTVILCICGFLPVWGQDNALIISADQPQSKISKHVYGQFSEHLGAAVYKVYGWVMSRIFRTQSIQDRFLTVLRDLLARRLC